MTSDERRAIEIELLAPARNREVGVAAINCGADAVYIGAERFGAREAAANSLQDISALADYAHRYRARVYVTLNTILRDDEFPDALALIAGLYDAGIDGLIVQDAGLLECDLPPLPLIASTQFHNTTPEQVRFLEQVGFQRVILARELTIDEIRAIRRATTVALECFVHGALCVCYSGRCYLSYAIGGRSGNRGCCAQPCRQRWALRDARGALIESGRYLLSLKDMNRSARLAELLDAGVTSFKIEGRLKGADYVMNVVGFYRRALDRMLDGRLRGKSASGSVALSFAPAPAKTFNRGFTEYFMQERSRVASLDTPKSRGERLGRVGACCSGYFKLDSDAAAAAGDGLCFLDERGRLRGTRVRSVAGRCVYPERMAGIAAGTEIFRNLDRRFQLELQRANPCRTITVTLRLAETPDGFVLEGRDEDGVTAAVALAVEKAAAEQPERALDTIRKQLSKLGGTEFQCGEIELVITQPCFIAVSELNRLRRSLVAELRACRVRRRPRLSGAVAKNDIPYPAQRLGFEANVLNRRAEAFYRRHGVREIAPAAESRRIEQGEIVMTTRYCLRRELGLCGGALHKAGFAEPLVMADSRGNRCCLAFDCERCEMRLTWQGSQAGR